jgi:hypothetical protein
MTTIFTSDMFQHVFWIGGSPCSGKSSIAANLANKYNLQYYPCDNAYEKHLQIGVRSRIPLFISLATMTWDEIWMHPVGTLLADEIEFYEYEFKMILNDLLALPDTQPVIAEGASLLPALVADIVCLPHKAIWIVATDAFQRRIYPQRGNWVQSILSQCSDPQQAFQNWMNRDSAFARWIEKETARLGLDCLQVDEKTSIEENTTFIEKRFKFEN